MYIYAMIFIHKECIWSINHPHTWYFQIDSFAAVCLYYTENSELEQRKCDLGFIFRMRLPC